MHMVGEKSFEILKLPAWWKYLDKHSSGIGRVLVQLPAVLGAALESGFSATWIAVEMSAANRPCSRRAERIGPNSCGTLGKK